jgi:hypothetical protein
LSIDIIQHEKLLFVKCISKIDTSIDFTPLLGDELVQVWISLVNVILVLTNESNISKNIRLQCKYNIWQNGSIILSGYAEEERDKNLNLISDWWALPTNHQY